MNEYTEFEKTFMECATRESLDDKETVREYYKRGATDVLKAARKEIEKEFHKIGETEIIWEMDGDRAFPEFEECPSNMLLPSEISLNYEDGEIVEIFIRKKK